MPFADVIGHSLYRLHRECPRIEATGRKRGKKQESQNRHPQNISKRRTQIIRWVFWRRSSNEFAHPRSFVCIGHVDDGLQELELPAEPTATDNTMHASASPLESLSEQVNYWHVSNVSADRQGQSEIPHFFSKLQLSGKKKAHKQRSFWPVTLRWPGGLPTGSPGVKVLCAILGKQGT